MQTGSRSRRRRGLAAGRSERRTSPRSTCRRSNTGTRRTDRASEANVGGWDGYYTQVAIEAGVETVATIDNDFERFDAFDTELVFSPEEFEELDRFLSA